MKRFEVELMDDAFKFIAKQDLKVRKKILQNLNRASENQDVNLLKKLKNDIWKFRAQYSGNQYRLLAFWYKEKEKETLVVATHGFVKKTNKVSKKEIGKAQNLRAEYIKIKER